jgi:hypothetical protein
MTRAFLDLKLGPCFYRIIRKICVIFLARYLGAFTMYFHIMSLGIPMKLKTKCGVEEAVIFDVLITV